MQTLTDFARLSLNQATTKRWSVREAVEGCARAEIPWIGLWRDKIAETGVTASARLVRDAGLRVSSLCRGGFFPAATATERQARIDDNRRAIDEAAEVGADLLVLVCGPAPDRDMQAARAMIADGIAQLIPYAIECGVKLGIEPLHPMYAADRSVIVTIAEATALAERLASPQVGVVLDVFHFWWDPYLDALIANAAGRILGFHVCDWRVPLPDMLLGRAMMGDGVIDIRRIRAMVEAAGYTGPIEVEIFNQAIWDMDGDAILTQVCERYLSCV
jgi:sugar phosphate isomerase/epimerase